MPSPEDAPLQELKFEPVPGYRRVLAHVLTVMALYLAVLLAFSPGQVHPEKKSGTHEEAGKSH